MTETTVYRNPLGVLADGTDNCNCWMAQEGGIRCDLCDSEVTPACSAIHISTGHFEGPDGERGFDICRGCAGAYPGLLEAIALASSSVTEKWGASMRPYREYEAEARKARAVYDAATAEHRAAYESSVRQAAEAYCRQTGEDVPRYVPPGLPF